MVQPIDRILDQIKQVDQRSDLRIIKDELTKRWAALMKEAADKLQGVTEVYFIGGDSVLKGNIIKRNAKTFIIETDQTEMQWKVSPSLIRPAHSDDQRRYAVYNHENQRIMRFPQMAHDLNFAELVAEQCFIDHGVYGRIEQLY